MLSRNAPLGRSFDDTDEPPRLAVVAGEAHRIGVGSVFAAGHSGALEGRGIVEHLCCSRHASEVTAGMEMKDTVATQAVSRRIVVVVPALHGKAGPFTMVHCVVTNMSVPNRTPITTAGHLNSVFHNRELLLCCACCKLGRNERGWCCPGFVLSSWPLEHGHARFVLGYSVVRRLVSTSLGGSSNHFALEGARACPSFMLTLLKGCGVSSARVSVRAPAMAAQSVRGPAQAQWAPRRWGHLRQRRHLGRCRGRRRGRERRLVAQPRRAWGSARLGCGGRRDPRGSPASSATGARSTTTRRS